MTMSATAPLLAENRHPTATLANPAHDRIVRLWLFAIAALVFLIVIVGGATRLTDSGLSITEWRPVTGVLPPLNHAQWLEEFEKYRQIPQYLAINRGMSLEAFKVIYYWEWAHRVLGRLIGAAMLLPWLFFVATGVLRGRWAGVTFGIGVLIALQGLVGWLMVASGLGPGMVTVAPLKLMFHLTLACVIFSCLVWAGLSLRAGATAEALPGAARFLAHAVFALLFVQIMLGALVAGNDAGMRFNDWPFMDGALIPPAVVLFDKPTIAEAFLESLALTQLNHRLGAYALLALAVAYVLATRGTWAAKGSLVLLGFVFAQAAIGVVTLLLAVPMWAGLLHQAFAIVVLGYAVAHLHAIRRAAPLLRAGPARG